MIPGNLPRRGRMPTAQQQRVMMQTVQALNNQVLSANGANTVSVNQDGISARNYTPQRIVARITGHGTGNLYSFEQVLIAASSGTVSTLTGGSTGTTTVFAAIELNGRTDVPTGTIVDMIADAGPYGFSFVYNGVDTSSGTLADAAVHVTATSGGTYTVKRVNRDSGGTLVESSPTVTYTGVYEAQGRTAVVDPTSTPTHELPLFIDKNGKYYFQIDQYAASNQDGLVSATTQTFSGVKTFEDAVTVNSTFSTATNSSAFTVEGVSGTYPYMQTIVKAGGANANAAIVYFGMDSATPTWDNNDRVAIVASGTVSCWEQVVLNLYDSGIGGVAVATMQMTAAAAAGGDATSTEQNTVFWQLDSSAFNSATATFGYAYNGGAKIGERTFDVTDTDAAHDTAFAVNGNRGLTGTYTIGGGATGDLASMTFTGGILTAVTLVP